MLDIRPVRKSNSNLSPPALQRGKQKRGSKKLTNKEGREVLLRKKVPKRNISRKFMDGGMVRNQFKINNSKSKDPSTSSSLTKSLGMTGKKGIKFQKRVVKQIEKRGVKFLAGVKSQGTDFWEGVKKLDKRELFGFKSHSLKNKDQKWYQRWWFNFFVIGFFVVLAIIMTYPLIKNFTTAIPGDGGDGGIFLWDMWWVKHAIFDLHQDPFFTDLLAAPHRVDLTFHTLALTNSLMSIPFQSLFGIIAAFNLVFLGGFVLTGWGTYLLVRYLTKSAIAGIVSGTMLAFAPYVMVRSLGHFNLSTIWPIPFFILFLVKMLYEKKWYPAIFAGIFAGLLCLNSLQYAVLLGAFVILVYLFYLIAEPKRFLVSTFLVKSILMVLVATFVFSPLLFPALMNYQENRLEKITLGRYIIYSADLARFVVPSFLSTFFGEYAGKIKSVIPRGKTEGTVFLGYTTLFLSIIATVFSAAYFKLKKIKQSKNGGRMRIWHWLVIGFIFLILSLGPFLHIAGVKDFKVNNLHFDIALPFIAIYNLPFLGDLRAPSRFSIFAMIMFVITAGIGLGYIINLISKIKSKWFKLTAKGMIGTIFLGLVVAESITVPMPIADATVPPIYEEIKKDPEDCVVLDLPCGWSTGYYGVGKPRGMVQTYQRVHQKKLISGFISRFPRHKVSKYLGMPGLRFLINPYDPDLIERSFNIEKIDQKFQELNIKYLIMHKKYYNQGVEDRLDIYIKYTIRAKVFYEDADIKAYRIDREHLPRTMRYETPPFTM